LFIALSFRRLGSSTNPTDMGILFIGATSPLQHMAFYELYQTAVFVKSLSRKYSGIC